MREKGFETEDLANKTPNLRDAVDKPSKLDELQSGRVDINVLKARAQAIQDKESIKNTIIIIFLLIALGSIGVFFSI
tara:strand:+ start:222 stop:452 length:231 start_codon:yes stop_codon:yes gene_type:complete